jgi:hypothetical protein
MADPVVWSGGTLVTENGENVSAAIVDSIAADHADEAALSALYVGLTGAQTVAGVKTFSSAPVVPDGSFAVAKTTGLQAALDLKAPLAGAGFTGNLGFYGTTPIAKQTGVAVTAEAVHAALVALGLIAGP